MTELLSFDAVRLGLRASHRLDAVRQCGNVLVEIEAVEPPYVDAMIEREGQISTSMGEGFAIPHGTDESRKWIRQSSLAFLQFPDGVDWGDDIVYVCVAIAVLGDEHVGILAKLAEVLVEPDQAARLRSAEHVEDVLAILGSPLQEPVE
jgi:mannitol/fructose-specific phosphotransferase system IIA component